MLDALLSNLAYLIPLTVGSGIDFVLLCHNSHLFLLNSKFGVLLFSPGRPL